MIKEEVEWELRSGILFAPLESDLFLPESHKRTHLSCDPEAISPSLGDTATAFTSLSCARTLWVQVNFIGVDTEVEESSWAGKAQRFNTYEKINC